MLHTKIITVALTVALSSCVVVAVAPVPGSETVRVTRNASEVSTCSAVGNIKVNASGSNARTEFRNAVVGFGGTAGLVTIGPAWEPVGGIAYRCP
jgi:curli biogenesis system outer membrane secretion channel CsgG